MAEFDDPTGPLPGDDDGAPRLRAMVRDPGNLVAHWRPGPEPGDGFQVRAEGPDGLLAAHNLPPDACECWLAVPPGTRGRIVLATRRGGRAHDVAEVPFETPPARAGATAAGVWKRASEGEAPAPVTGPAPGGEGVIEEERSYHGSVWKPS